MSGAFHAEGSLRQVDLLYFLHHHRQLLLGARLHKIVRVDELKCRRGIVQSAPVSLGWGRGPEDEGGHRGGSGVVVYRFT